MKPNQPPIDKIDVSTHARRVPMFGKVFIERICYEKFVGACEVPELNQMGEANLLAILYVAQVHQTAVLTEEVTMLVNLHQVGCVGETAPIHYLRMVRTEAGEYIISQKPTV